MCVIFSLLAYSTFRPITNKRRTNKDQEEVFHHILLFIIEDILVVGRCVSFFVLITFSNFRPGENNRRSNKYQEDYNRWRFKRIDRS